MRDHEIGNSEVAHGPGAARLYIESAMRVKHNRVADGNVHVVIPTGMATHSLRTRAANFHSLRNGKVVVAVPRRCTKMYTARACAEAAALNEQIMKRTVTTHIRAMLRLVQTDPWNSFVKVEQTKLSLQKVSRAAIIVEPTLATFLD